MRKNIYFLTGILILSTLLSACAGTAFAQSSTPNPQAVTGEVTNLPMSRTLNVTGSGKAYLTPDIAYVNIGVHTEDFNAAEAVAANSTQTREVAEALKKFGIADKDIKTTNFSIYPQQDYDLEGKPTGKYKYIVDNTVFVTVRDLDKIGDLLDAVVKAGANSINGIQFDVADKTTALSDARKAAVQDARAVAEELAAAAGVTLGVVQTISVYGSGYPSPVYDSGLMLRAEEASVPVSPGQMILTVEVNIVFEIH